MPRDARVYQGYGNRRYSGKNTFLICLGIATVAAVVTAALIYFGNQATGNSQRPAISVVNGNDPAAQTGALSDALAGDLNAAGTFDYRLNPTVKVSKGIADWKIENPVENTQLMKVIVTLEDGQTAYTTDWIPPFHYIRSDKPDVKLKTGAYHATVSILAFDRSTHEQTGTAEEKISINVD